MRKETKMEFNIGDKVEVSYRIGRKLIQLRGEIDQIGSSEIGMKGMYRIRMEPDGFETPSGKTCGWFSEDSLEPEEKFENE